MVVTQYLMVRDSYLMMVMNAYSMLNDGCEWFMIVSSS